MQSLTDWILLRVGARRVTRWVRGLPRPEGTDRRTVLGPDPLRVLITGGGLACGYGASSWDEALGAAFADCVVEQWGRGVVVEQMPLANLPEGELEVMLASVVARRYSVFVWTPSWVDGPAESPDVWRVDMRALLRVLDSGDFGPQTKLILEIPEVLPHDQAGEAGLRHIRDANRQLEAMLERYEGACLIPTPPIGVKMSALGPDYYRAVARAMTDALESVWRPAGERTA